MAYLNNKHKYQGFHTETFRYKIKKGNNSDFIGNIKELMKKECNQVNNNFTIIFFEVSAEWKHILFLRNS